MLLWARLSLHRQQIGLFPGYPPVDLRPGPRSPSTVNSAIRLFCELWTQHTVGYVPHDDYGAVGPITISDFTASTVATLISWYRHAEAIILPHLLLWKPCYPSRVTGFAGTGGNLRIDLTWDAAHDRIPIARYDLERRTIRRGWRRVSLIDGTTYADVGLVNGTAYQYRIRAVDGMGWSGAWAESFVVVPTVTEYQMAPAVTGLYVDGPMATFPAGLQWDLSWDVLEEAIIGYALVHTFYGTGKPYATEAEAIYAVQHCGDAYYADHVSDFGTGVIYTEAGGPASNNEASLIVPFPNIVVAVVAQCTDPYWPYGQLSAVVSTGVL